ncbi:MAG: hypothetical protein M1436_01130 [Acidobacteria bacterium]|nr:hypothetical protein [Acidobacteriota bacterium]
MNAEVDFDRYLRRIPDEMLEIIATDFVWLAYEFRGEPPEAEYIGRREACRRECLRRGCPELFRKAQRILSASYGEAA